MLIFIPETRFTHSVMAYLGFNNAGRFGFTMATSNLFIAWWTPASRPMIFWSPA